METTTIEMDKRERSASARLADHVGWRAAALAAGYGRRDSSVVATLARLRRSAGAEPGGDPVVWAEVFEGFPEGLIGDRDEPNEAELAAFTALTLFAVHQQSKDHSMHVPRQGNERPVGLGDAIRRLEDPSDAATRDQAVMRRFLALATADSFSETAHHLRGLVQQLRAHSIGLDYGRLAADLLLLQFPAHADRVRLAWARQMHGVAGLGRGSAADVASDAAGSTPPEAVSAD